MKGDVHPPRPHPHVPASTSTTARVALPRPWRRKLAAPAAAPVTSACASASPWARRAASAPIIASPQPSRKPCSKRGGVSSVAAPSPSNTSAESPPRVTITVSAPASRSRCAASRSLRRLGHRSHDVLGELPVVELDQLRSARAGRVQARAGEVDEHAHAVGARVGDEVAVELQRQRVGGQRVGHDEPAGRRSPPRRPPRRGRRPRGARAARPAATHSTSRSPERRSVT